MREACAAEHHGKENLGNHPSERSIALMRDDVTISLVTSKRG